MWKIFVVNSKPLNSFVIKGIFPFTKEGMKRRISLMRGSDNIWSRVKILNQRVNEKGRRMTLLKNISIITIKKTNKFLVNYEIYSASDIEKFS